ncbi:MAG: 1,4-alpha-glucan branching protein GlgB [Eubacteriales bacterium]|nr:1,4-alpha-glucan branching protein GlgB [Eubacteriales bacterium]
MGHRELENAAYLYNIGQNQKAYEFLGSQFLGMDSQGERYRFSVWAPNALKVCLVGDFNGWQDNQLHMHRLGTSGIWYLEQSGLRKWQRYKYAITGMNGFTVLKADPFARHAETRPGTASILYHEDEYVWRDEKWLEFRAKKPLYNVPLNIYELHLGSWRRHDDEAVYNYRDLAKPLADYLTFMGYNAVEFMPLMEYPLDASWGYQVSGYFAPTSRYGLPEDLKYLVDHLHQRGITVLLDWVPAHFPKDAFALAQFDGTATYEYADNRLAEHREWGTLVFDYSKLEVRSFLYSAADYWLSEFHFDGLRVDAVSSMLYLNYGRDDELRNSEGGEENLEAIEFLQELNTRMRDNHPGIMMIAEESTAYPKVTAPVEDGGLGFTHKWNMGWMNDSIQYFSTDHCQRPGVHNKLTFAMTYSFSEHFILPFSHDEVVHGKASMLQKMPGDYWRQFAGLRTLFAFHMTHPGQKLNFMGNEFAPYIEWRYYEELEWFMLGYEKHEQMANFVRELNHLYIRDPAFWADDNSWQGFSWLQVDDIENEVFAYVRRADKARDKVVLLNLTPQAFAEYKLPVHRAGKYKLILNSDEARFGGSNYLKSPTTEFQSEHDEEQDYLEITLPPLAALIFEYDGSEAKETK